MAKRFYLIRHAESESNAGVKTAGLLSINLTQTGRDQAEAKAAEFTETPDLIVTSSFIRTKQTAEPFVKKFPDAKQEEWDMQEFTFLPASKYNGTTHEERYPSLKAYWDRGDPYFKEDEGAESFVEFITRIRGIIDKIGKLEDDVTLGFSHGYVMAGIAFVLEGRAKELNADTMHDYWQYFLKNKPGNTETMEFEVDNGKVKLVKAPEPPAPPVTPAKTGGKPPRPQIND